MPRLSQGFKFEVVGPTAEPKTRFNVGVLRENRWDDYGYKTTYNLQIIDANGERFDVGPVKIGRLDFPAERDRTDIPKEFVKLSDDYFSVGQNDSYYQNIKELGGKMRLTILEGLNDFALSDAIWDEVKDEHVTQTSLMREIAVESLEQFRKIARGGARLTPYNFAISIPPSKLSGLPFLIDFNVEPDALPPTNVHALIGRNGVGKTYIIDSILQSLAGEMSSESAALTFKYGNAKEQTRFSNIVSISFSAFDHSRFQVTNSASQGIPFRRVGLVELTAMGDDIPARSIPNMIARSFASSLDECMAPGRIDRWKTALESLESDPGFSEHKIAQYFSEQYVRKENSNIEYPDHHYTVPFFQRLSSGHQIVLLTITKLVESVVEKTLVLIDEPETHLHPPLLSAFIRCLSHLLIDRNGVAIVTTHSPVVLQEVPKSCVWIMNRTGNFSKAERPTFETFGENLGTLTREVFGYEVTESGFHRMLKTIAAQEPTYESALDAFGGELGGEARAILRSLYLDRENQ